MSQEVVIAGALFSDVPSISVPDHNGVYHGFTDVSDTTAAASDVASGKYFYASDGTKTEGTASGGSVQVDALSVMQNGTYTAEAGHAYSPVTVNVSGGGALKVGAIRPDAELVQKWTYDKLIVQDEGVTIPAYSTSVQTLKASEALSPSIVFDVESYAYLFVYRSLAYPIYSSTSKGKGRCEYHISARTVEIESQPAGMFKALVDSTSNDEGFIVTRGREAMNALLYWSSGSKLANVDTSAYGVYTYWPAETIATGGRTINSPSLRIRGQTSYLNSTYWGYITDIRFQYVVEVYRAPLSATVKGWDGMSQIYHARDCVDSASHTLT